MTLSHAILYMLAINIITFLAFGMDKRSARRQGWRIPEGSLLLLCLLGGSIGGYMGQRFFSHKTQKSLFRFRFWSIIVIQFFAALYYCWKHLP